MNVFVETNFVLELALEQQESPSCERLLALAAENAIRLLLPAYSFIEPHETLTRRHRDRETLRSQISNELAQLARRNPGDFDNPSLRSELTALNCKYFSSFATSLQFIEHTVGEGA